MLKNNCTLCKKPISARYYYNDHKKRYYFKNLIKYIFRFKVSIFARKKINYCEICEFGELSQKPSKDKLSNYYRKQYWKKNIKELDKNQSLNYFLNLRAISQRDFIGKKNINNFSKILDIGAGPSSCCLSLKEYNNQIEIYTIEESNDFDEYYFKNNINLISKTFPFISEENLKFDYIHMSHVLEHFLSLDEVLKNLEQIIKKNGIIFIEVPNCSKEYWLNHVNDEPHIYFFSKKSLLKIFNNDKYDIIKLEACGESWSNYIKNYLKKNIPIKNIKEVKYNDKGIWLRMLLKKK